MIKNKGRLEHSNYFYLLHSPTPFLCAVRRRSDELFLRRILANRWAPVASSNVQLRDDMIASRLHEWQADHEFSELDFMRRLLPSELLRQHLLSAFSRRINEHVSSRSRRRQYLAAPITEKEFWYFFAQRAIDGLKASGRSEAAAASVAHLDGQLLSEARFKVISFCAYLESSELEAFMQALFVNLQTTVKIGNYGTVDETILPFRGAEARHEGLLVNMPGKKRAYGLLLYSYVSRMVHSRRPLYVLGDLKRPGHMPTAAAAFLGLADRVQAAVSAHGGGALHVIGDKAFSTEEILTLSINARWKIILAVGEGTVRGVGDVRKLAIKDLPPGKGRSYRSGSLVLQFTQSPGNPEYDTSVISTAATVAAAVNQPAEDVVGNYSKALNLFNTNTRDDLCRLLYGVPPASLNMTARQMIKERTGFDVCLPAPDDNGRIVVNEATLEKLSMRQWRELLLTETGQTMPRDNTRPVMWEKVKAILPRLQSEAVEAAQADQPQLNTDRLLAAMQPEPTSPVVLCSTFTAEYHLLDWVNRELFGVFKTTCYKHWQGIATWAMLTIVALNARALFDERAASRAYAASNSNQRAADEATKTTASHFIANIIHQIHAEQQ
jgi:hypothetical protein